MYKMLINRLFNTANLYIVGEKSEKFRFIMKMREGGRMKNRVELDLLEILLKEQTITAKALAARLGVSNRTIRSYLDDVQEILRLFDLTLIRKCGIGYWIEGSLHARLHLQNYLEEQKNIAHRSSPTECIDYLLYALLTSRERVRFAHLAQTLYISRSSLYGDLKKAQLIVQEYHLRIEQHRSRGIVLYGDEKEKRKLLFWLVKKIHNENDRYYQNETMRSFVERCFSMDFTNEKILQLLHKFEEKNQLRFGRNDLEYLRLMFYLSIERIRNGFDVTYDGDQSELASKISFMRNIPHSQEVLDSLFHIPFSEAEIRYLSLLFLSLQHTTIPTEDALIKRQVQHIIERFTPSIYQQMPIRHREEFENGLRHHLMDILSKARYDYDYSNPQTARIKEEYTIAYVLAEKIVPIVQEEAQIDFPDDEVAYIAVHIAAAIEQSIEPVKVLFLYEHRYSELKFAISLIQAHIKEIEIIGVMRYQDYRMLIDVPAHAVLFTSFAMQSDAERIYQIPLLPDKTFINDLRETMRRYFVRQDVHLYR